MKDPQATANGYFMDTTSNTGEAMKVVQPPVQSNETPVDTRPAPAFNAHDLEILRELGLDDDQILDLKLNDAIA